MSASNEQFCLASAKQAAAEGRLSDWVGDFLASPGSDNAALAAALAFEGVAYAGPLEFPLDRLTPLAGPDEDEVLVPVEEDKWEHEVEAMEGSIADGWEPPPVLVSHHDGEFFLEDGNHRHESLRRIGATTEWAILVFSSAEDRDRFLRSQASEKSQSS